MRNTILYLLNKNIKNKLLFNFFTENGTTSMCDLFLPGHLVLQVNLLVASVVLNMY